MIYDVQGDVDDRIEAESEDDAAIRFVEAHAGFDCDEFCTDGFSFSINDIEYCAEPQYNRSVILHRDSGKRWLISDGTIEVLAD